MSCFFHCTIASSFPPSLFLSLPHCSFSLFLSPSQTHTHTHTHTYAGTPSFLFFFFLQNELVFSGGKIYILIVGMGVIFIKLPYYRLGLALWYVNYGKCQQFAWGDPSCWYSVTSYQSHSCSRNHGDKQWSQGRKKWLSIPCLGDLKWVENWRVNTFSNG